MTKDKPLCIDCKYYKNSKLCKIYEECPDEIFGGENCKYFKTEKHLH